MLNGHVWLVAAVLDSTRLEVTEIQRGAGHSQEARGAEEHAAWHHEEAKAEAAREEVHRTMT